MEAPGAVHVAALRRGRLAFQRCEACAAAVFFPRVLCPRCGGRRLGWEESPGRGTVYSATAVHSREGVRSVVLVDLDEGFRVMSEVVGADPEAVPIGADVRARVLDGDEPRLVFELA